MTSTSGRRGVLAGFVAASAFALIPLAAAGAAWADDDFAGDSGAAVTTPVGNSNIGGGADLGLPNPLDMLPTFGDGANGGGGPDLGTGGADVTSGTGAAVATPVGQSSFTTGTSSTIDVPNPLSMIPIFGEGANAGGGATFNTPLGGSSFNTGGGTDLGTGGAGFNSTTGAGVNTPLGGSNVGGGTNFNVGH